MMRIAMCLIKRLGWLCEDMQSFKNYYLVGRIPLSLHPPQFPGRGVEKTAGGGDLRLQLFELPSEIEQLPSTDR